jgi:hypothetical protein
MEYIHIFMFLLLLFGGLFIMYTPRSILIKLKKNVPVDKARNEFREENKIPLLFICISLIILIIIILL